MQPERFDVPPTDRAASVREAEAHETALTYRAMAALRQGRAPLATVETFVTWVNTQQRPEGYRLVARFAAGSDEAVAVAGFRWVHALLWGTVSTSTIS